MTRRARQGFTLIEISIVVAMVLVLTAIGIGMSDEVIPRFRTRKAALHFASMARQCQSIAVRTGRECSIQMVAWEDDSTALQDMSSNTGQYWVGLGGSYSGSCDPWDLLPEDDLFEDGTDSDTSQGLVELDNPDSDYYARHVSISLLGTSLSGTTACPGNLIVFSPRGYVENDADFDSSGHIMVRFVNQAARAKGLTEDYMVTISRAGMVRVDETVNNTFVGLTAATTEL